MFHLPCLFCPRSSNQKPPLKMSPETKGDLLTFPWFRTQPPGWYEMIRLSSEKKRSLARGCALLLSVTWNKNGLVCEACFPGGRYSGSLQMMRSVRSVSARMESIDGQDGCGKEGRRSELMIEEVTGIDG